MSFSLILSTKVYWLSIFWLVAVPLTILWKCSHSVWKEQEHFHFYCWVVFYCMHILQFIYSFIYCFLVFDYSCNELNVYFCVDICFYIDWLNTEEQDFWVVTVIICSVKLFWHGCSILYFGEQCAGVAVVPSSFVNASYCHLFI